MAAGRQLHRPTLALKLKVTEDPLTKHGDNCVGLILFFIHSFIAKSSSWGPRTHQKTTLSPVQLNFYVLFYHSIESAEDVLVADGVALVRSYMQSMCVDI
jgi:hypothetical protein